MAIFTYFPISGDGENTKGKGGENDRNISRSANLGENFAKEAGGGGAPEKE